MRTQIALCSVCHNLSNENLVKKFWREIGFLLLDSMNIYIFNDLEFDIFNENENISSIEWLSNWFPFSKSVLNLSISFQSLI